MRDRPRLRAAGVPAAFAGRRERCFRLLAFAALLPALLAAQDAKEIVRRAIQVNDQNEEVARNYTYLERRDVKELDGAGHVKEQRIETVDVTMLAGTPYRRLVARNDKPLPPDEQKKEEEKLRRSNEERSHETEEQRSQRIADTTKKRDERQREPMKELLEAFDFRVAGQEAVEGRAAWIVDATPHPGFKGATAMSRAVFPKVHCRFWIDKDSYHAAKLELDTLDTISLGLVLVRLAKGAHVSVDLAQVNNEVWLPKQVSVTAVVRVLLVKDMRVEMRIDYSEYKKFQADSHLVNEPRPNEPRP